MIAIPELSFAAIAPQAAVLLAALAVLLADLFVPKIERINITLIALLGLSIALIAARSLTAVSETGFSGMILRDEISLYLDPMFLIGAGLIVLLSHCYAETHAIAYGESIALLLFATLGMMTISLSADLVMLFIGIELLSLCLYVLTGFDRTCLSSGEASFKYFLLGAFSTGFLVYGMAFVFGVCRTTNLDAIGTALYEGGEGTPLLILGFALMLVGLGFKISLVPFHMWAPDVYQGAPTPVAAWIAAGSKMAGFIALIRIFSLPGVSFAPLGGYWTPAVEWLAMLTMIVGNAGALMQNDLKRMLAYSSIAHGGYLSMAFVAHSPLGLQSMLFYLAAYLLMTVGVFGVAIAVRRNGRECRSISDFAGLARQHPVMAGIMSLFLFSLAGMPCTAGFVGKLWLFGAAIQGEYYALAVVGILTTLLSFYYYLRVIVFMYMHEPEEGISFDTVPMTGRIATGIAAFGVLLLGIYPNLLWRILATQASGL